MKFKLFLPFFILIQGGPGYSIDSRVRDILNTKVEYMDDLFLGKKLEGRVPPFKTRKIILRLPPACRAYC